MSTGDGYFHPDSMLRRVHRERAVGLLYGQRALAIGAIDPRNFVGTIRNSGYADRPFHRLAATGKMFEAVQFGSRAEADRVLTAVHGMHSRVDGTLPEDAGRMPAGTPYSAMDPELMLWTIAVSADSAMYFYELLVGKLTERQRDAFWRDYVRFGELFGMAPEGAPASWREFRRYFDDKVAGEDSFLTEEALYVGSAVMFEIPVPRSRWPAMRLHNLLIRGSLPPCVRRLYRLGWSPAHEAAFRAAVRAHRTTRPLTPRSVLRGSNASHFELVAATEARRIATGRPTPGVIQAA